MKNNKSYLTGILGGLVGGFIASVPWILMYVYGKMILSLLAIIIAMGALKGYQLCKGKVNKSLPLIITIISLICVTVSTLVIIPVLLIEKQGANVSIDTLKFLYSYGDFTTAIMKDYIISVLFTFLGISGVISNIKKQLNDGATENIKANLKEEKVEMKTEEKTEEAKEEVKEEIKEEKKKTTKSTKSKNSKKKEEK